MLNAHDGEVDAEHPTRRPDQPGGREASIPEPLPRSITRSRLTKSAESKMYRKSHLRGLCRVAGRFPRERFCGSIGYGPCLEARRIVSADL